MKRISILALIAILAVAAINQHSMSAFSSPDTAYSNRFAYGVANENSYDFRFIDPSNPNIIAVTEKVLMSQGASLYDLSASPNGQWITMEVFSGKQGDQITTTRLLNVATGQVSGNITTGVVASTLFFRGWDVSSPSVDILWSPNSQYIAFNMLDTDISPNIDIYVYSLADHKLTDLTINDHEPHYRMAWSSDSTQLVTTAENCASSCSLKLEILNLVTIPSPNSKVQDNAFILSPA